MSIFDFGTHHHHQCDLQGVMGLLKQVFTLGERAMSAISDFAAKQKAFNDATKSGLATMGTALTGIKDDIQGLNDKITQLQNNPGPISPDDQKLLDDLQLDGQSLADGVKIAADAFAALDAQTPPVVPPTP